MLNQVCIVGRLASEPTMSSDNHATFTLACPRTYKNSEGIYETDFIDCNTYNLIATNVVDYCHKGDIVGVKGRLETEITNMPDGLQKKTLVLVAEKVTFLSSKSKDEE